MKLKSTSKALAKALPPLPNRGLRSSVAAALILHFTFYILHSPAAEPLCWERTPNRPAPAQFDTFHGEALDFRCTFTGFGALPFPASGALAPRLYYQTNGMGKAWWSIPATVSYTVVTNCQPTTNQPTNQHTNYQLSATFPPSADPGAERLTVFFGAPSNAYAAAQVRFRNSPGAHPNDLDPPSPLDWQAELAAATNALWESSAAAFMPQSNAYTKAETDARIAELAPRTRLVAVTNSIIVPERIEGGNWTYGNSIAGDPTGDLFRDAALTASATDGSIYWSAQTDYTIEGEGDTQFYRYAIAWYNPYTETFQAAVWSDKLEPMPSVLADISLAFADQVDDFRSVLGLPWPESFATLDTPEPDAVDWGDFYSIPLRGTSTAYVPTQAVETVVYSLNLAAATNGLARLTDLATATNDLHKSFAPTISNTVTKAYVENLGIIATNNPAFVAAVTNCPVAIESSDAEALTEWGIYGGGGTIGALLAALAAAVAALKKKKMPLYPVGGTGNPVNATYESGVLTVSPFAMAAYTPTASAAFSVAMGALPSDMEAGKARDAVLVIDCSSTTEGDEPTVTWDAHYHPRTDTGTDFACVAGAKNVYYISEYVPGEFAVGGWTETAGGNA